MPSSPDSGGEQLFDVLGRVVSARRMVRAFVDAPVDQDVLVEILDRSLRAPSAGNAQALELLVLRDDDVGAYWDLTLPPDRRPRFPWPGLLRAPILVVPYVDPAGYVARYREPDKVESGLGGAPDDWPVPYWWVDGGAAVQTMLLAVAAAGLGACFFGQFDHEPAVRARFGVPDHMRAVGTVAIGRPDPTGDRLSESARRGRRPFDERVHWSRW